MKASRLCFTLGAAHLARCAPVPAHSDQNPVSGLDGHHLSTPLRPTLPHPAHDELLPPLSRHRTTSAAPSEHLPGIFTVDGGDDLPKLMDTDTLDVSPPSSPPGLPSNYYAASRERNDMLVVFLAVAFMVVVVVMETWGSIFRRQGAIRLVEKTPGHAPAPTRPFPEYSNDIPDEKRRT